MPISFPVARSTILLCDYSTGFREPEMVKRRPVVVVSHRLPRRDGLCTVVPLSTTPPPVPGLAYVYELTLDPALPEPFKRNNHVGEGGHARHGILQSAGPLSHRAFTRWEA